jgi:hypothetical protein
MDNMNYELAVYINNDGDKDYYHLTAKTDIGAMRQAKKILSEIGKGWNQGMVI